MQSGLSTTIRAAFTWAALGTALFLVWYLRAALLLIFGAILLAVLLRAISHLICRLTSLSYAWGLFLATSLVVGAILFCIWIFGTSLVSQFRELLARIGTGTHELAAWLEREGVPKSVLAKAWGVIGGVLELPLSSVLELGEIAIIVGISAIYLAVDPDLHRRGFIALFPPPMRPKVTDALDLVGSSLKLWMLGQLCLMGIVGVTSYVAVLSIGLPNPLALALVAAITEAVPYLGPFVGAAPAVLTALAQGVMPAVFTVAAYLGIHMIGGYAAGPLLQRWFVHIPPVLILVSIFISQLLFGVGGFLLAAPLAVAIFSAVKVLYVRDTLHQPVDLPKDVEI